MFETQLAAVVDWQSSQPFGTVLILVVQLGLVTLVAWGLSRLVSRSDPSRTHGIWLAAILLGLALLPLHALQVGWPVPVALATISNDQPTSLQATRQRSAASLPLEANLTERGAMIDAEENTLADSLSEQEFVAFAEAQVSARTVPSVDTTGSRDTPKPWNSPSSPSSVKSAPSGSGLTRSLVGVYLAGLILFASRLFYAMLRLRLMRLRAGPASKQTLEDTAGIAALIGSRSVPDVRQSDQVSIPMVCGYWRPLIMLPSDFDLWSQKERQSALLHELTHIRWTFRRVAVHARCGGSGVPGPVL